MVQITRPGEFQNRGGANIPTSVSASAGQGQVAIGREVIRAGRAFQSEANQIQNAKAAAASTANIGQAFDRLMGQSKNATNNARISNKLRDARKMALEQNSARYDQKLDDKGNPTYENLVNDIKNINAKIRQDVLKDETDPAIIAGFDETWLPFAEGQEITAFESGLNQQNEFVRASLDTGLQGLIEQASTDTLENVNNYINNGQFSINQALNNGIIDQNEFETMKLDFQDALQTQVVNANISKDRARATEYLAANTAESLGISPERKAELEQNLVTAEASDVAIQALSVQTAEIDKKATETRIIEEANMMIEAGGLRGDQLIQLQGQVSDDAFTKLVKKAGDQVVKEQKRRGRVSNILEDITAGRGHTLTKSKVDEVHNYLLEQLADVSENPVTLAEEAKIAASIPAKNSTFTTKIHNTLMYGDSASAEDAVAAVTYLRDLKSPALDTLDKNARAIVAQTELFVEKAGMDPRAAMTRARENIMNVDENISKLRKDQFRQFTNKGGIFNVKNIADTAMEDLVLADKSTVESLGQLVGLVEADPVLRDETAALYKRLVQEEFFRGGDIETARKLASDQINLTHGVTAVNGELEYTYLPVEKVHPELSAGQVQQQLRDDMFRLNALIGAQGGDQIIDPSTIQLQADMQSIGPASLGGQVITWVPTHLTDDGYRVPVTDSRGNVLRWSPVDPFETDEAKATRIAQQQQAAISEEVSRLREENTQEAPLVDLPGDVKASRHESVKLEFLENWNPEQDEQGLNKEEKAMIQTLQTEGTASKKDIRVMKRIINKEPEGPQKEELKRLVGILEGKAPESRDESLKLEFLQIWNSEEDEQGLSKDERDLIQSLNTEGKASQKDIRTMKKIINKEPEGPQKEELKRLVRILQED